MNRRQEVILKILQWLEGRESPWDDLPGTQPDPVSGELMDATVVRYHIDLCEQAGFVRIMPTKNPQIQLNMVRARGARGAPEPLTAGPRIPGTALRNQRAGNPARSRMSASSTERT